MAMLMIDTEDNRTAKALQIAADAGQWIKVRTKDGQPLAARLRRAVAVQSERALLSDHEQLPVRRLQAPWAALQARAGSRDLRSTQAGVSGPVWALCRPQLTLAALRMARLGPKRQGGNPPCQRPPTCLTSAIGKIRSPRWN